MDANGDQPPAWPVARQGVAAAIRHPGWEAARNAILDRAAQGPATILLVGPAGAGKSWLLRELAGSFGDHGFPTTLLLQGNLPTALGEGTALLVDEALGMPDAPFRDLLGQQVGLVVLADGDALVGRAAALAADPVVVHMPSLRETDVADFTVAWLERRGLPGHALDAAAVAVLAARSGGTVQLLARALKAAADLLHSTGRTGLSGTDMARIFDLRLRGLPIPPDPVAPDPPPAPAEPPPPPPPPASRRRARAGIAALAIAAGALLVWGLRPRSPAPPLPQIVTLGPASRAEPAPLPPVRPAELSTPAVDVASRPVLADTGSTALAPAAPPAPSVAPAPPPADRSAPALAAVPPPATLPPAPPRPVAAATAAPLATPPAPALSPAQPPPVSKLAANKPAGAPGMVLLAGPGATLRTMYRDVYGSRPAPSFEEVRAANPRPIKAGSLVVFPAPPGGWGGP